MFRCHWADGNAKGAKVRKGPQSRWDNQYMVNMKGFKFSRLFDSLAFKKFVNTHEKASLFSAWI